jgi:hypothetical protein
MRQRLRLLLSSSALPVRRSLGMMAVMFGLSVPALTPQAKPDSLPFAPGERLTFTGRVRAGVGGGGSLWIDGPQEVRGTSTWVLHSDMEGRVGPIRATTQNASWLDPVQMTALRYTSRERHFLSRHDDDVEIFPSEGRWSAAGGLSGELSIRNPLDELSFLYYLRTLPFSGDSTMIVSRHFDVARNPTNLRLVGREEVEVGAGRFRALVVEMRVRDTRRYHGEGVIRVTMSDDRCRLILRLESTVPDAGTATLSLKSYEGERWPCTAQIGQ